MTRRLFGSPQLWNKVRRYSSQPEWIGSKNCWREAKIQIVSWSTPLQTGALEGHLRSCPVDSSGTRSCASKSCSKMMMVSAQPRIGLRKYTLPADKLLSRKLAVLGHSGPHFPYSMARDGLSRSQAAPGCQVTNANVRTSQLQNLLQKNSSKKSKTMF